MGLTAEVTLKKSSDAEIVKHLVLGPNVGRLWDLEVQQRSPQIGGIAGPDADAREPCRERALKRVLEEHSHVKSFRREN
jgi:hypothetical protein